MHQIDINFVSQFSLQHVLLIVFVDYFFALPHNGCRIKSAFLSLTAHTLRICGFGRCYLFSFNSFVLKSDFTYLKFCFGE